MAGTLAAVLLCSLTAAAATLQPPRWLIGAGGYPRGLELGGNSHGTMLVCAGGGAAGMAVYRGQLDAGPGGGWTDWVKIGVVRADPNPGTDISNCVLQQLAGSELLAAYRHHTGCGPDATAGASAPGGRLPALCTNYTIQVSHSSDLGASWQPRSTVVQSAIGMWEPFFFQRDSGLAVAYSQELSNGGMQSIVWKTSTDAGRSWGPAVVMSDGTEHRSRDGMPGIARLHDRSLLLVFEGFWKNGWGHFSVQMRRSFDDGATWDGGEVLFAPNASHNAGAPQVAVVPTAGRGSVGTTAVSNASSEPLLASSELVFVSFMTDEDAGTVSWPGDATSKVVVGPAPPGRGYPAFDFAGRRTVMAGPGAMWPGLVPVGDGEVFATVGAGGTAYLVGPLTR